MEDEQPLVSGETETTISGGIQTPSEAGIILLLLKRRKEEKENSRY